MRKFLLIFCLFSFAFLLPSTSLALSAEAALDPPVDWAWLVSQVESGLETITLPNSIECDGITGLKPENSVKIIGNGFSLTGVLVDGGTVFFEDVLLNGINGLEDEDGGAALTLRGEGTKAVLSGASRAIGGFSGPDGSRGGDGIVLSDDGQGVILRGKASVSGNVGRLYGGAGIRVLGCNSGVLATNTAIMTGHAGTALGGAGIEAPGCCKITLSETASASGGQSPYDGGSAIDSQVCAKCTGRAQVRIDGYATLTGGVGEVGGSALRMVRTGADKDATPDLVIADNSMLLGASGGTAGSALQAEGSAIQFEGTPKLFSGSYYVKESPVLKLSNCETTGDLDAAEQTAGEQTQTFPARDASQIIQSTLSQQNARYEPKVVENGLNTRMLASKLDGHTVEKGKISQANLDGKGLLITMWDGTLETRLQFQQYLMSDGADGLRFVIIGTTPQEWPTVRSTVGALNKLKKEGFTQFAYTCIEPVYNERIIDIHALLEAVEAYEEEVKYVYLGTSDDCVIFVLEDERTRVYQEELMAEIVRPLEEAPEE